MGIHSTNNIDDNYLGSGVILLRAIKKYGKEEFTRTIVKQFNNRKEASDYEKIHVTEEVANSPDFYNIKSGGDNECVHSRSVIEKVSKLRKGSKRTKEQRKRMSIAKLGRTKYNDPVMKKMSETKTGRTKYNNESVRRMAISQTGKRKSNNLGTMIMSIKRAKGFFITPIGSFYACNDASDNIGLSVTSINRICHNNFLKMGQRSLNTIIHILPNHLKKVGKTYKELGFSYQWYKEGDIEKMIKMIKGGESISPKTILQNII